MTAKGFINSGEIARDDKEVNFKDYIDRGKTGLEWEFNGGETYTPEPEEQEERKSNKLLLIAAAIIGIYNIFG